MATSIIYDKFFVDLNAGAYPLGSPTVYKCMLVNGYTATSAQKTSDTFRSALTEITGTNYTPGGNAVTLTTSVDASHQVKYTFTSPTPWTSATITATGAVIYRSTGTAATDNLVCYIDFGGTVTSTNGTYTVTFSTPMQINNT